jgi:hypothetical protein
MTPCLGSYKIIHTLSNNKLLLNSRVYFQWQTCFSGLGNEVVCVCVCVCVCVWEGGGRLCIHCCICFYGYGEQKTNVNWLSGSDRETDDAYCALTAATHVKMSLASVHVSSEWDTKSEVRDSRARKCSELTISNITGLNE